VVFISHIADGKSIGKDVQKRVLKIVKHILQELNETLPATRGEDMIYVRLKN